MAGGEPVRPLAAQVIQAFVDKQRRLENNLLQEAIAPLGAMWSETRGRGRRRKTAPAKNANSRQEAISGANPDAPDAMGGRLGKPAQDPERDRGRD